MRALEIYLEAVGGPQVFTQYAGYEDETQTLDAASWAWVRREMSAPQIGFADLRDDPAEQRYRFEYEGQDLRPEPDILRTGPVNFVFFWLPTEYLETHGPARVRELALTLASLLPYDSGHGGLSFNSSFVFAETAQSIKKICFRYPGIDIPMRGGLASLLGTRIDGVHWLNFLGPVVLKSLGGVEALRARLSSPGTTVQELGDGRALVSLGEWPEAGDLEAGKDLPAYRELARVLEPCLFELTGEYGAGKFSKEELRRWGRRFLD
ncbi:MAG: DUF3396 domain-containing protein [Myxococcaceae bacterium]|nr:DUF3396 domain-containing protein [Myxococcaceae bacterium]